MPGTSRAAGVAAMARTDVSDAALRQVLRDRFGHTMFRPGQREVVRSLLDGADVLAVLPTGAGKSLVYQLTAQFLPGVTLVISPLLALMKDQVDSLTELGLDAGAINSLQSADAAQEVLEQARRGETKLLYVTPERLDDAEFVNQVLQIGVSLFVVDEAHSISEWGHSFRPAYLGLAHAHQQLRGAPILALTATATQWVRRDIVERLDMRDPVVIVRGTDRPNLFLEVVRVEEEHQDAKFLRGLMAGDMPVGARELREVMHGSGIIYTATTRAAQETAAWLQEWGISADYYHGRLKKSDRERVQGAFMDGEVRVIVATNAFGLGVDKPDVRFVIHRDSPASVEAYYQEAGRAGRDGEPARCVLIYRPGDLGQAAFLAGTGQLTLDDVECGRRGLLALRDGTVREMEAISGLTRADLLRLLEVFEDEGIVSVRRGRIRPLVDDFDPTTISLQREEQRRAYERSRLEMMRGYAELRDCRRRYILNYFGEEPDWQRCERCDVDLVRMSVGRSGPPPRANGFEINERVEHVTLGQGTIQRVVGDTLTVLFDGVGYKTLAVDLVEAQQLLHKISSDSAIR
jgi:ATP-dependent DNA helicase RecQ